LSFSRFSLLFSLIAVVLGVVFYSVEHIGGKTAVLVPKFWVIFGFQFFITLIAFSVSLIGIRKGPETGTFTIIGSITIKMLFSMGFVLAYLLKINVNGVLFAIHFFSLYFLFTAFEVYGLLCNLRDQNKT
jgi:hypothetical protein